MMPADILASPRRRARKFGIPANTEDNDQANKMNNPDRGCIA